MKRCIFHYLHPIDDKPGIGSALRPNRMLEAFRKIGYEVDVITGYSTQRRERIRQVKQNIRNGILYDFVYSESVNEPTALSDADHIPRHPFMDFGFLRFCRKRGIPVGLFYRDMPWKFPVYRNNVSHLKQMITLPLFRWDLCMYRKCVDTLFVPSEAFGKLVPHENIVPLPPGGQLFLKEQLKPQKKDAQEKLHILYVGNVLGVYDVTQFCKAVSQVEGIELTICTPKQSWDKAKQRYEPFLCNRIHIVHKSGAQLQPHYLEADLFCCCIEANEYTRLAMPIKTFESIGYGVPIMITQGIAAAELVKEADCGWVVDNSAESFKEVLFYLEKNPHEIETKTKNVLAIAANHTWENRAKKVSEVLLARKEKEKL